MKKERKKKYMLFLYGEWDTLTKITKEVSEIMKPVMDSKYLKFIYGDNSLIAHFQSYETLDEIKTYIEISFDKYITAFFLLPTPRNIGYRLDDELEEHLFRLDKNTDPYFKYENPEDKYPFLPEELYKFPDRIKDKKLADFSKLFKEFGRWPDKDQKKGRNIKYDLDTILDKILKNGKESLTKSELNFLKNYGKK